ncbi:MAG: sensor domain-containing protein [Clostridium sp.]
MVDLRKALYISNLKYNSLLNTIPSIAWFVDKKSKYIDVNDTFIVQSGKELKEILGKTHKEVWGEQISTKCYKNDSIVITSKAPYSSEEIIYGQDGHKHFKIYRSPVIDDKKNIIGIIAVGIDITDKVNMETKFRILIENIPFMVWYNDKDGRYLNSNTKFASFNNTTVANLIGKTYRDFFNKTDAKVISAQDNEAIRVNKTVKFNMTHKIQDTLHHYEIYKTPVINVGNEVMGIVGTVVDVTEIIETRKNIEKQAFTDYNTNLQNRRALYAYLDKNLKDNIISMFLMDIDNFKYINDNYGHNIGDFVLLNVAQTLSKLFGYESVFRLGGDEFVVIFKNASTKAFLVEHAEKLLQSVHSQTISKIPNERISLSIGIASCDCNLKLSNACNFCNGNDIACKQEKCNSEDCKITRRADIALYASKKKGKNCYEFYSEDLDKERHLMFNIAKDLGFALERDEISLFYQPQYTTDRKLIGFEALFRWKNKKYSKIPIIKIISIMEKSNLIIDIGRVIIEKACLFAKKINKNRTEPIIISFNVSSIQIMNRIFLSDFKSILEKTNVSPSLLGVEVTESILLENITENIQKLQLLKDIGIKIILDDFGTGYSSLNYLVKFPLSIIKIDKSFINDLEKGTEYKSIIKLIIDCSHSLSLDIIAEGVETEKQLKILKDMNVNIMQGYLFSHPVSEEAALSLIE